MKAPLIKALGLSAIVAITGLPTGTSSYIGSSAANAAGTTTYPIVGTNQTTFYNNSGKIRAPKKGKSFYGQDAAYNINPPSYTDNKDGTVKDNVTGLTWEKSYQVLTYNQALEYARRANTGGYSDWRLPNIKELYSLVQFSGVDASGRQMHQVPRGAKPFIDTRYFDFDYGSNGQRIIDTQILSSTLYTGSQRSRMQTVFGLNVADGRIKSYPLLDPRTRSDKAYTVRLVRGNPNYGKNSFTDNRDGTITDKATDLMWTKNDSGQAMSWEAALNWVQQLNTKNHLGYSDWRLPDAKELQSIVDYSRSPRSSGSAAIDPVFSISQIRDEGGNINYPYVWSSTSHVNSRRGNTASQAVYISFGEALGFMRSPRSHQVNLMDVHGAGAQRSDPKTGSASNFPNGRGPQGDTIRIKNYARAVRTAS